MEALKTLLIANRGEIAVRILKTAREHNIRTIARMKQFFSLAHFSKAYIDGDQIIEIAKRHYAEAIIPGYGFLSENSDFARAVASAGLVFVGPSPESIEDLGLKHTAREPATKAGGMPIVPDSEGLVISEDEAVTVMLKATAGGGGMGLLTCNTEKEVRKSFQTVQVFGNGQGNAISISERECSIQRRYQKNPELRKGLYEADVRLAESINYGSAGTTEYLVDDELGAFFSREMNTQLQVEHGITKLCCGVDLVGLMLKQHPVMAPNGAAIEARVYAENPVKDFAPCPGTLQSVQWKEIPGSRIDTCVYRRIKVSVNYEVIDGLKDILIGFRICGPLTNLGFLPEILANKDFNSAIDVVSGGAYTLIQDWPGRPTVGKGFCHPGRMDSFAFRIANALVGNPVGLGGLEITLSGPALFSLCGAPIDAKLDDVPVPMWSRVKVSSGRRLKIGKTTENGCRAYLAVFGGLLNIAEWFGSKATAPMYPSSWELMSMPEPYDERYLTPESIDMLYDAEWTYGYGLGSLNWTGYDSVIFPQDAPDLGGFGSRHTIVRGDFWKLGQVKAGDNLKFRATSLKDALAARNDLERFIADVVRYCQERRDFGTIAPLSTSLPPAMTASARGTVSYRQLDYDTGAFDLNHRYRVTALKKVLSEAAGKISFSTALISMVGCGNSLMLYYDGAKIPQQTLIEYLCNIESQLGDLSRAKMTSRLFKLPLTFESKRQDEAIQRYMETQRPYASYLPDNMDFPASWFILVGFFTALPLALPGVDILGSKQGYSPQETWLFEGFDQITFYRVSEEEYERQLALFQSWRYEYEWEEVEFDMAGHNRLLIETKEECKAIRGRQRQAQAEMGAFEKEMLERWAREKAERGMSMNTVDSLLKDPKITAIEAPLNANVWKVEVKEGDKLEKDHIVVILEAMKLEIAVRSESIDVGAAVESILAQ
ncbi:hypothetical protein BDV12DRAFT_182200 [Aspergillus spectabilis]